MLAQFVVGHKPPKPHLLNCTLLTTCCECESLRWINVPANTESHHIRQHNTSCTYFTSTCNIVSRLHKDEENGIVSSAGWWMDIPAGAASLRLHCRVSTVCFPSRHRLGWENIRTPSGYLIVTDTHTKSRFSSRFSRVCRTDTCMQREGWNVRLVLMSSEALTQSDPVGMLLLLASNDEASSFFKPCFFLNSSAGRVTATCLLLLWYLLQTPRWF